MALKNISIKIGALEEKILERVRRYCYIDNRSKVFKIALKKYWIPETNKRIRELKAKRLKFKEEQEDAEGEN